MIFLQKTILVFHFNKINLKNKQIIEKNSENFQEVLKLTPLLAKST